MTVQDEIHTPGGKFKPGHKRLGGRPKGKKNRFTLDIRSALLMAGEQLGADGEGAEGLTGLFKAVGRKDPKMLASWIADLVPRDAKSDEHGNAAPHSSVALTIIGVESGVFLTEAECKAAKFNELPPPLWHTIENTPEPATVIDDSDETLPPAA